MGTSGWMYGWNREGNLDWYVVNSGLNAIELNASFYRFLFPSQAKGWRKKGEGLRWAVKVHRSITHFSKFKDKAYERWKSMKRIFSFLDDIIDFYLFQLPPSFSPSKKKEIEKFFKYTGLGERFALEPREASWWDKENIEWAKRIGITWVSVDAPELPKEIVSIHGIIYLRMHGRTAWYSHYYTDKELKEICKRIVSLSPNKVYVFFNNDHAMLENAQRMLKFLLS